MEMRSPSHENGATTLGANSNGVGSSDWLETTRPTRNKIGRLLRENRRGALWFRVTKDREVWKCFQASVT